MHCCHETNTPLDEKMGNICSQFGMTNFPRSQEIKSNVFSFVSQIIAFQCLVPVYACSNSEIVTVEGIGNRNVGYTPEQNRLLNKNGSQCGYCSSGMLMNMHCLMESNVGTLTMEKVENSFGGNLCRCTGYRPILDAFKSLAIDAEQALLCHVSYSQLIERLRIKNYSFRTLKIFPQ